ncbi:hypothetical protein E2C01_002197 [Portunus trituberculatus]|uniref:Uncharacterized protein n=1 Tax=Portunus trituberculatus TaxID=210409 RepID=A0A5B7CQ21_PORTR|nr:hypothetical protein [Portunus trituberculatus]
MYPTTEGANLFFFNYTQDKKKKKKHPTTEGVNLFFLNYNQTLLIPNKTTSIFSHFFILPINALVVVLAIEELHFLKCVR